MSITIASRKQKGRNLQNFIKDTLIKELDINVKDIKSTPMGCQGCDIWMANPARDKFPFGVEAKYQENLSIWKALEQCETNAIKEGLKPALVFRRNRTIPWIAIKFEDFIKMQHTLNNKGDNI